jgi:hypothetical protein
MIARDYEAPADAGGNNVYDYILTATDADGNADTQTVAVTVTDVVETPPTLELLPGTLDGVTNLDVKSQLILEFNQDILLADGEIRIMDDEGTSGWIMTNPDLNRSRQDVWDNDVVFTITGGVVTNMTVGGIGYASLGNGVSLADLQASVSVVGNKLIIDPAGLDSLVGNDWDFDFDFGAEYHIELSAGVVTTTDGLVDNTAVTDPTFLNFKTVTPLGDATGAASQKMLSDGTLSDSYIYHHGARSDQDSAGFAMDFSVGSHVLVIETGGGATKNTGIDGVGGRILLSGFSADDLIYNDNMGNMALLTTDFAHAASWTGSGNTLTRFQSSDASELQQIVFTDYAGTGFTTMANLFYSQADGRFEDSGHYNANVIIFG